MALELELLDEPVAAAPAVRKPTLELEPLDDLPAAPVAPRIAAPPVDTQDLVLGTPKLPGPIMTMAQPPGAEIKPTAQWERDMADRPFMEAPPVQSFEGADVIPNRSGGSVIDRVIGPTGGMLTAGQGLADKEGRIASAQADLDRARLQAVETRRIEDEVIAAEINPTTKGQLEMLRRQGMTDADNADREVVRLTDALRKAGLAPAAAQGDFRDVVETVGSTLVNQSVDTAAGLTRVLAQPGAMVEEALGGPAAVGVGREIDKSFASAKQNLQGFTPDAGQQGDLTGMFAQGAASTVAFATGGLALAKGLGLSAAYTTTLLGSAPAAEQAWQEASARGLVDGQDSEGRKWLSFVVGAGIGATEAIPVSALFTRLERMGGTALTQRLGAIVAQAGEEGLQEFLQTVAQNTAREQILGIKPEDSPFLAAMIGAGVGGGMAAGGFAVNAARSSFRADTGGAPVPPPVQIEAAPDAAPIAPLAPDAVLGDAMQGQARPLTLEPLDADPAATVAQAQRTLTLEPIEDAPVAAPVAAPETTPAPAPSAITPPAVPPAGAVPGQDPTAPVPTAVVPVVQPGADTAFLRGFADDKQMRDPDAAISKLETSFSGKLAAMVRAMPDDVRAGFKIASGWRSDEQQATLNPKYGIKAAPGKSRHNGEAGSAVDVSEQDGGKALAWIRANGAKYGLELPHADDPNHLQEAGARGAGGAAAGQPSTSKGIFARISSGESDGDYNVLQGGSKANLTGMTIAEVQDLQSKGWGGESTAAGRWQVVRGTLAMAVRGLGLDPKTTKFDEATQNRVAQWLLDEKVGYRKFKAGEMSQQEFLVRLRNEWVTLKNEPDAALMALVADGSIGAGTASVATPGSSTTTESGDAIDAALMAPQPVDAPASIPAPPAQDFASAPRAAGPSQTNTISTNLSDLPQLETKPIVVDLASVLSSDQPGYDQVLQPRDRAARKGSEDQIRQIAGNLDPAQLMPGPYPDRGAPIVNERGMVESGNGRVMAIRQAYQRALPGAAAYKAALAARGYDVSSMSMPVLVQQRMTPLTPQQIQSFVHGANKPAALTMSASEQAKADGGSITSDMLAGVSNRTNIAANPDFVRAFMQRMTPEERASLIDKDGNVSQAGQTRMRNAVFAAAYGNSDTLARVAEATDDNTRGLSAALMASAPEFAKLRQMIADGVVPARFDVTEDLVDAVNRISQMREKGQKLDAYMAQIDAFNPIPEGTEWLMSMFYSESGNRQISKDRITDALRWYAQEAMKVQEGGFDMGLPAVEPKQLIQTATAKARNNDGQGGQSGPDLFAAPGAGVGRPSPDGEDVGSGGSEVRGREPAGKGDGSDQGDLGSGRAAGEGGRPEGGDLGSGRRVSAAGEDGRADGAGRGQDPQRAASDGARPEALTADDAYDKETGKLVEGFLSPVNNSKFGPVEIRRYPNGAIAFDRKATAEAEAQFGTEYTQRTAFMSGANGFQWSGGMPINVKYADIKDAYWAGVAFGRGKPAPEAADGDGGMLLDTDGTGDRRPRGGLSQTFEQASFTNRRSIYEQAFTDAGLDPNATTLLAPEKQIEILTNLFRQRFGIKVVEAKRNVTRDTVGGNKVSEARSESDPRETIDQLLDGYRNIQFMMRALQMPVHAVSLERTDSGRSVTMSMEAAGRGYLGAYDPGSRTVHLPGRTNSFAHEWMHALDHFLMDEIGGEGTALLSRVVRKTGNADMVPATVAEAFVNVVYRTMFNMESVELRRGALENANFREGSKAAAEALRQLAAINEGNTKLKIPQSKFRQSAAKLGGDPAYWASAPELLARAFEAYVAHRVDITNPEATQEFITKGEFNYLRNGDRRFLLTFPKNRERVEIFRAFDQLFDMMRQESLFGPQRALTPASADIFSSARFNEYRDAPIEGSAAGKMVRAVRASISRDVAVLKGAVMKLVPPEVGFDNRGWADKAKDTVAPVAFTISGEMHMIASRYAGTAAEAPMREIADMFATRPGSGLLQKQTYDESVKARTKNVLSIVANILATNNLTARTPNQAEKLRALMTSQITAQGQPANLVSAAADLARLMQEELYYNKQAGVDVRHVASQGYLPRVYLTDKIDTNRAAFIKDAARVYGSMFDADVMEGGVNVDELLSVIRDRISDENRTPEISQGYADIQAKLRQIRGIEAKIEAGDKDAATGAKEIAALEGEIEDIAREIAPAVRTAFSGEAARDWQRNISLGSPTDYDTKGPASKYTKARVLPAETDGIMKDWLAADPVESIVGYLQASSRRAEYVMRAGKDSATLEGLLSRAEEAGAGGIEIRRMRTLVETLAGRDSGGLPRDISKLANKVYAVGTLALLPRAVIASITEPMATMIRTGDIEATISGWAALIRQTVDTGNRAELAEIANAIGLTTNVMYETIVTDRLVSEIQDKNLERRLSNMFRTTGLTSLTNAQRRSLLPMFNNVYLPKLLSDATGDDARKAGAAKRELAELGIAEADIADMRKWVSSRSTMPRGPELQTRAGRLWGEAANRIIDQIIQDPTKADKPQLASNPFVRFTYGIMSFNYSFQRKVLQRTYQKVKSEWAAGNRQGAVGVAALNAAAGAASLYTATLLVTMLRAALFDGDRWEEEEKKGTLSSWLAMLAFDRTGFVGAWSPIMNAITGIKFDRDLSSIFAGAQVGFFLTGAQRMLQPYFGRNSERTNTTEHRALKAFYQTFAAPALVYAMTAAPGGALAAGIIMGGSSSTAGGMFADAVLGKSDSQIRKDKKAAGNGSLPRPPGLTRN